MDEPLTSPPRRDWQLLLLLLLLALGLRAWQVKTTEVAARDSIAYVRMAWRMEHGDWRQVVREGPHHPAYPLAVLAASSVVRRVDPGPLPDVMQHSAQAASSLAGVLLVVPMFFLGRELFDRRVGFWAALLFQCLPASGRILADGLSEALFFLFAATAFWLAVVAFNRRSPWPFAGVGLFGALAYLTRPEGALIVTATGVVLVALQTLRTTRRPWGNFARSATSLTLATLLLAGPFVLIVGRLTPKHTANQLLQEVRDERPPPEPRDRAATASLSPALFGVYWPGRLGHGGEQADQRLGWALTTLLDALWKGSFYVLGLPALLALWRWRDRFRLVPGVWVMAAVCGMLLVLLFWVAVWMGYLSERHTLLILFSGGYWAAAGLLLLGDRLAAALRTQRGVRCDWAAPAFVVLACAAGATRTLEPLHGERTGFREAGHWLAENAQPTDKIDDPYAWAKYYAGRYFTDEAPPPTPGASHSVYVVVEWSANKHPRLTPESNMEYVFRHGERINSWPVRRGRERAEIVLYHVTF
jgi:hypothetical protein